MARFNGIVLIDRNRIDFYQDNMPSILSLEMPITIVKDLEVLNLVELNNAIKSFVEANKLTPSGLIFILATPLLFEKKIDSEKHDEQETLVQSFLEQVPFENVASRLLPQDKGLKVVATNSDFISSLKTAFENVGFLVEAIVAHSEVNVNVGDKHNLDLQEAAYFMKNYDSLKQFSFSLEIQWNIKKETNNTNNSSKKPLPLLPILLVVFSVLIGVLFFFLFKK